MKRPVHYITLIFTVTLLWISSATAQQTLTVFEKDDFCGYKNGDKKVVVPAKYYMCTDFDQFGHGAVIGGEHIFYIDTKGQKIIEAFSYDNGPDYFEDGLARFVEKEKIGYHDEELNIIIPARFDFAYPFEAGKASYCKGCTKKPVGEHYTMEGGTWGFIDLKGNETTEPDNINRKGE